MSKQVKWRNYALFLSKGLRTMQWIRAAVLVLTITAFVAITSNANAAPGKSPIHIVIWDERQPAQKQAYENFLGNYLAAYLTKAGAAKKEFEITSVGLDEPDQGLPIQLLDKCDVLIWWGHQRHDEV